MAKGHKGSIMTECLGGGGGVLKTKPQWKEISDHAGVGSGFKSGPESDDQHQERANEAPNHYLFYTITPGGSEDILTFNFIWIRFRGSTDY